ncbi:MAG: hypothetical protein ABIH03_04075 [Pseudomonadota bacterium]
MSEHLRMICGNQAMAIGRLLALLTDYRKDHFETNGCGPVAGLEGEDEDDRCGLCVAADKLLGEFFKEGGAEQ